MILWLGPDVVYTGDVVFGYNKLLRVIDAVISEIRRFDRIIILKAISIDNTVWFDGHSNDRNQRILRAFMMITKFVLHLV